jgi:thioredoxin-like negative regulator of GroEL
MTDNTNKKPPLGAMPASVFYAGRILELTAAAARYINAGKPVPDVWQQELDYLADYPAWRAADAQRSERPSESAITTLIGVLRADNRAHHGGTHPGLIAAIDMLERLKPRPVPTPKQLMIAMEKPE